MVKVGFFFMCTGFSDFGVERCYLLGFCGIEGAYFFGDSLGVVFVIFCYEVERWVFGR